MNIAQMTVKEFVDEVASKSPAPGGGAVGAVVTSLAAALAEMVANLTLGKKKYQEGEAEMERVVENMEKLRDELCELARKDIEAFNGFMEVLKLPKETEEQKKVHVNVLQV